MEFPVIITERLKLRQYELADVPAEQILLSDWEVVSTTATIPYPYPDGRAEEHIRSLLDNPNLDEEITFAVTHLREGYLIGGINLCIEYKKDESMQLAFWIGKSYWNQGYCTEAALAVVRYGFEVLGLNRIYARHFTRNPASGRVLQKIGMKHEGTLRQDFKRWDKFEDVECYGILRSEYVYSK